MYPIIMSAISFITIEATIIVKYKKKKTTVQVSKLTTITPSWCDTATIKRSEDFQLNKQFSNNLKQELDTLKIWLFILLI